MSKSIKSTNKNSGSKSKKSNSNSKKSSDMGLSKRTVVTNQSKKSIPSPNKKTITKEKKSSPQKKKVLKIDDDNIFIGSLTEDTDESLSESIEKQIDEIRNALEENYIQQKKLMLELDKLILRQNNKNTNRSSNSNNYNIKNTGKQINFDPEPVPPQLKKLLKIESETMPRLQVVKIFYQYLIDNKLCNPKTKEIIANKKIIELFKMKTGDTINYYNLQSWIKKLYCDKTENVLDTN